MSHPNRNPNLPNNEAGFFLYRQGGRWMVGYSGKKWACKKTVVPSEEAGIAWIQAKMRENEKADRIQGFLCMRWV